MKNTAIIGTWAMSLDAVRESAGRLSQGTTAADAVESAIRSVEDNPAFSSVGFGGLPALDGQVYLDAGWMDGDSLRCGAVLSVRNLRNPVSFARSLCGRETDWMLCGPGAEAEAAKAGFPTLDMRTPESLRRWEEELKKRAAAGDQVYRGHDTVCVLALDTSGSMIAGTSTSGLFLKVPGRVGDTPVAGSGYYCDSTVGAAAATGLGEDIMRGCLSYEIVSRMRRGATPMEACEETIALFARRKLGLGETRGSFSVIALDRDGRFGAATTEEDFPYAAGCNETPRLLHATWQTLAPRMDR